MIKSRVRQQNHFKSNILQIKVNKINKKNNSPSMVPHQENNYYYNTKINGLIFHEAPDNNRNSSKYQPLSPLNKDILIEYDFLANSVNNIICENKQINSLYKKDTDFQKLPITVNIQKKANEIEINNFYNKNNVFKDINGFNYININRNIINNYNQNSNSKSFYEKNERNMKNYYRKNTTDEINTNLYEAKNNTNIQKSAKFDIRNRNKKYFNNVEDNNINSNSNSKYNNNNNLLQRSSIFNNINNINSFNNKCSNFRKIPIKQGEKVNYYIGSPIVQDPIRLSGFSGNIKLMSKNRYKSPEIILSKSQMNNDNFSSVKNDNEDISNVYKSEFGFYKRKEENKKNSCMNNINNLIDRNKSNDNINKSKDSFKSNTNNSININFYDNNSTNNTNNLIIENSKILNPTSDIYLKIKPSYKFLEISDESKSKSNTKTRSKEIENISNNNINNIKQKENKLKKLKNYKKYIRNKLIDNNLMKKNMEEFCEILEQVYFISFKKSYNFFIKKLLLFNKSKNSNRSIILRRFKDRKNQKFNNIKSNNSMININNKKIRFVKKDRIREIENKQENQKEIEMIDNIEIKNKTIENNYTNKKFTTKFDELKSSITHSMKKINQDNYIKIFNNIFNKQRIENKRCRSPLINRGNFKINNNLSKDSFDNEEIIDNKYNKYDTNTNINICFHKNNNFSKRFNNLKISTDIIRHNNDSMNKKCMETSLNDGYKIHSQNTNIKGYRKNILKMKKLINNNINSIENININSEENNYEIYSNYYKNNDKLKIITKNLDNKYFIERNVQKNKMNCSLEPFTIDYIGDSENKHYKKLNQSKNNISLDKNKNNILYSKPLFKKSTRKNIEIEENSNNNNISDLHPKRNERNIQILTCCSCNHFFNRSLHSSKNPFATESKKIVNGNKKNFLENKNEIIVKNVGTEDKRLHVFIKYITLENCNKEDREKLLSKLTNMNNKLNYNYSFDQSQFINKHIDTINLIRTNKYKNNNSNLKEIKDEENFCILKRNNKINIKYNNRYIDEEENEKIGEIKDRKNIDKKKLNISLNNNSHKLLKFIDEEEEKSKNQNSINNNSNNSGEEINDYICEEVKNSINYLISLLQNRYDDNKKSILYNFFKNLRKIKTNSLLLKSVKFKGINKIKNLNQISLKKFNDVKNNRNDYNNSNQYYTKIIKKNKNYLNEKNESTQSKSRNLETKKNLNSIKKKDDKEDKIKKIYNYTQEKDNFISISFRNYNINNKSINSISNNSNKKNESMKSIKVSLLGSIKKLEEEAIKIQKKKTYTHVIKHNNKEENNIPENENIDEDKNIKELDENEKIDEEKEKMKEKKLAKLGKLFNNLNQENNLINAIKEQFLDWTSKNDFPKKKKLIKDYNRNNGYDDKKKVKTYRQYEVKTFDMDSMFNKDTSNLDEKFENDNKDEEFKRKIHVLKNKLILFFIKNRKKVNENENNIKNEKQSKFKKDKIKKYKGEESLVNEEEKKEKD